MSRSEAYLARQRIYDKSPARIASRRAWRKTANGRAYHNASNRRRYARRFVHPRKPAMSAAERRRRRREYYARNRETLANKQRARYAGLNRIQKARRAESQRAYSKTEKGIAARKAARKKSSRIRASRRAYQARLTERRLPLEWQPARRALVVLKRTLRDYKEQKCRVETNSPNQSR